MIPYTLNLIDLFFTSGGDNMDDDKQWSGMISED